jgi:GTPase SAR1 family protein
MSSSCKCSCLWYHQTSAEKDEGGASVEARARATAAHRLSKLMPSFGHLHFPEKLWRSRNCVCQEITGSEVQEAQRSTHGGPPNNNVILDALNVALASRGLPIGSLLLCYRVCRDWREMLKNLCFSYKLASLCVQLAKLRGTDATAAAMERCLSRRTAFHASTLMALQRHRDKHYASPDAWAQLLVDEQMDGVLAEEIKQLQLCWNPECSPADAVSVKYNVLEGVSQRYIFRVIIDGVSGVGKSCLVHRFLTMLQGNDGGFTEEHVPTAGIEIFPERMAIDVDGEIVGVTLQVWDVVGLDQVGARKYVESHLKGHCLLLVYGMTLPSTFADLKKRAREMRHALNSQPDGASMCLVANKCDILSADSDMAVMRAKGQALAHELACGYIEVSAKSGVNVKEAFVELIRNRIRKMQKRSKSVSATRRAGSGMGKYLGFLHVHHSWK